ncbi:hypothetical protein AALO_G00031350 [Alosa alosa]|uniref:Rhodanese domain-containing protein n=1 Tax=Alosa alosa TaxID=278164 RepID=A0AAV6HCG0_9TELE|nr:thiosulfate:glutathione sulfurtransferase-like [Alosa alosa]KAG5284863.1 hypothetical protein AALO_G00031350 [Alosa alosa]
MKVISRLLLTFLVCIAQNSVHGKEEKECEVCEGKLQSLCQGDNFETSSTVSISELRRLLAERKVRLFDVREPDEFAEGHIPTAINVPLGELKQAFGLTPDQFAARYGTQLPPPDATNVVLYCQRGRRSAEALDIICGLGYHRARHYAGGYSVWSQHETL